MITLTLDIDSPDIAFDLTPADLQRVAEGAAIDVQDLTRTHFESLPGTTFWAAAARSTKAETVNGQVAVNIYKRGVALQYYGGTVRPVPNRVSEMTGRPITSLFIPFRWSVARGKTLADTGIPRDQIDVIPRKGKSPLLVQTNPDGGKGTGTPAFSVLGVLVKRATINPHPDVLPTRDDLAAAAEIGAADILQNIIDDLSQ